MHPAHERVLRVLERVAVPDDHRRRLAELVLAAEQAADQAGEELQSEFGKEHLALIAAHNQFLRIYRGGPHAGKLELLLADVAGLEAGGFELGEAVGGQVFRLFGWRTLDPMQGDAEALRQAVVDATAQAMRTRGPA